MTDSGVNNSKKTSGSGSKEGQENQSGLKQSANSDEMQQMQRETIQKKIHQIVMNSRILELQLAVDVIWDNNYAIIASDLKNPDTKEPGQQKKSRFRGVSLNGKKWQVSRFANYADYGYGKHPQVLLAVATERDLGGARVRQVRNTEPGAEGED